MSRRTAPELAERLARWAERHCTAHGRLSLDILHAVTTPAANDADGQGDTDIDRVVQRMLSAGRWKEARVLLVEYAMPDASEALRLRRLSRMGLDISRRSYYTYLDAAHACLEVALAGSISGDPAHFTKSA